MRPIERLKDIYSSEPARRGWLPWGALAPVLALAFVIGSVLAGLKLIEPFVSIDAQANPMDATALMAFTLVPFGILLGVILLWVKLVERRPFAAIGLTGEHKWRNCCFEAGCCRSSRRSSTSSPA
jgi:hypothetical protein